MKKPTPKFTFEISKEGKLIIIDKHAYETYKRVHFKPGTKGYISLHPHRKIRSTGQDWETGNQNGYYWGVVLPIISDYTGHTPDELHEIYKQLYASKKRYHLKDGREVVIAKSTGDMDTIEFKTYIERIRADAGESGIVIPDPEKMVIE